jgi:hypothetical protein
MPQIFPIDFTYCQKIGEKVEVKEENYGNVFFGSLTYMEDNPVSQKDDLISVCYLIIYCLNLSNLPMLEEHMLKYDEETLDSVPIEEQMGRLKSYKKRMSLSILIKAIKFKYLPVE